MQCLMHWSLYACSEIQFVDSLSRSLKSLWSKYFFFFLFSQKNLAFCHLSVCSVSGIQKTISTYYETAKGHKESKSNSGHLGSWRKFYLTAQLLWTSMQKSLKIQSIIGAWKQIVYFLQCHILIMLLFKSFSDLLISK